MAEPMSDERFAEIRGREQAATEGPWWFDESEDCWRLHGVATRIPAQNWVPELVVNCQILKAPKHGTPYAEYWPSPEDGAFIAHARQDVRDLLAEVDRLREELAERDALHGTCADEAGEWSQ